MKLKLLTVVMVLVCLTCFHAPLLPQEICSEDGTSKMRAAGVSAEIIASICLPTPDVAGEASVFYRDFASVLLDGNAAVGKAIAFDAEYEKLSTLSGRPCMIVSVDTETALRRWYLFFEDQLRSSVANARPGQKLSITCKITEVSSMGSECDLTELRSR